MNNENVQDTRYRTPKEDTTQKAYEEVSRHTEIQGRHDNRHDNLGHLHWDAVSHLPQAGIGVIVEGKNPKEVCEPCQLAAGLH